MSDTPSQQVPAAPQSLPPVAPQTIVVQSALAAGNRRWLTWLGWLGFLICGLVLLSQWSARQDYYDVNGGIREKFESGSTTSGRQGRDYQRGRCDHAGRRVCQTAD